MSIFAITLLKKTVTTTSKAKLNGAKTAVSFATAVLGYASKTTKPPGWAGAAKSMKTAPPSPSVQENRHWKKRKPCWNS